MAVVGFAGKAGKSWFLNYRAGGPWVLEPLLASAGLVLVSLGDFPRCSLGWAQSCHLKPYS